MSGRAARLRTITRMAAAERQTVPKALYEGLPVKEPKPLRPLLSRGESSRRGSVRAWRA